MDQQQQQAGPEPNAQGPRGGYGRIVAAVLIVIIGLILFQYSGEDRDADAPENDGTETTQESPEGTAPEQEFERTAVAPDAFAERETAERIINRTQGKTSDRRFEHIQHGVVQDPDQQGHVYFATADENPNANFVGVYRYDTATKRWWRMHKRTYAPEQGQTPRVLHVLAKDGRELVIRETRLNAPRGACDSYWLGGGLYTLNLDAPLGGLEEYPLPDDVRQREREREQECRSS